MRSLLAAAALVSVNALAASETIEVVGLNACKATGFSMSRCSYEPRKLDALVDQSYIPRMTRVSVFHEGNCSTQYPIDISVASGNGGNMMINALRPGEHLIAQNNASLVEVNVVSPWAQHAYYYSSCRITANVETDIVDEDTLLSLASNASERLEVIEDQIGDKSTILTLLGIAKSLEAIIDIAEQDSASVYELNTTLQANCDNISPCTWTDQIGVILDDPSINIPTPQLLLLFSLAFDLDSIVPADCYDNNCVAELVNEETRSAILTIRSEIDRNENGDYTDEISDQIKLLLDEKLILESRLEEIKAVADKNGIVWSLT